MHVPAAGPRPPNCPGRIKIEYARSRANFSDVRRQRGHAAMTGARQRLFGERQRLHSEAFVEALDLGDHHIELALKTHQRLLSSAAAPRAARRAPATVRVREARAPRRSGTASPRRWSALPRSRRIKPEVSSLSTMFEAVD